jgi:hypothetical protein
MDRIFAKQPLGIDEFVLKDFQSNKRSSVLADRTSLGVRRPLIRGLLFCLAARHV